MINDAHGVQVARWHRSMLRRTILALTRPAKVVSFSRHNREGQMATNRTYVKSEVVGSSDKSVSDAIESAIAVASRSLRNLEWFEVIDVRGSIRDNKVANYQVTLKLGLRYETEDMRR